MVYIVSWSHNNTRQNRDSKALCLAWLTLKTISEEISNRLKTIKRKTMGDIHMSLRMMVANLKSVLRLLDVWADHLIQLIQDKFLLCIKNTSLIHNLPKWISNEKFMIKKFMASEKNFSNSIFLKVIKEKCKNKQ